MKKYKLLIRLLSILMVTSQAVASSDIHAYIDKIKARAMQLPDSIPSFQHRVQFSYSENENRPSPFQLKTLDRKVITNAITKKNSIQKVPLEDLKFVGIIKQKSKIWALISYPGGELSRVAIGDPLGVNAGKIVEVSNDLLRVEERVLVAGKWEKRTRNIYLIERD